jgi:hypothetical protein
MAGLQGVARKRVDGMDLVEGVELATPEIRSHN